MISNPLVSVVLPNYNGIRFLEQAIESVIKQTYTKWELIIVDDSSTDASPTVAENYCRMDSRIHLIRSAENHGVSETRNIGIRAARGEYIALIDNDDLWEPDKLERQLCLAECGADIVYCSYDFCNEEGIAVKKAFIVPKQTDFKKMLFSSVLSCSSVFVKANLLKEHPFCDKYYHEDYLLWMELLRIPVKAVGDKKVLMHYRQVSGSRSQNKVNAAKERWKIYRKALKLNLLQSLIAFAAYTVNGISKYFL